MTGRDDSGATPPPAGRALGAWAEHQAAAFLEFCGYEVLDRRFRRPGGELDLVVGRRGLVVFVEVKARGPGALDRPEAWIDCRKRRLLRRIARRWLAEHPERAGCHLRIDVIAVDHHGHGHGYRLRHLPDAL